MGRNARSFGGVLGRQFTRRNTRKHVGRPVTQPVRPQLGHRLVDVAVDALARNAKQARQLGLAASGLSRNRGLNVIHAVHHNRNYS